MVINEVPCMIIFCLFAYSEEHLTSWNNLVAEEHSAAAVQFTVEV